MVNWLQISKEEDYEVDRKKKELSTKTFKQKNGQKATTRIALNYIIHQCWKNAKEVITNLKSSKATGTLKPATWG